MAEAKKELITDTKNDNFTLQAPEKKLYRTFIYFSIVALLIGGLMGLLQTIMRAGKFTLPFGIGYYQILTVHGVVLALVLTTYFIIGFMLASQSKTAGTYSPSERKMAWIGFWLMTVGVILTTIYILLNKATVLYTFYAPLQAHPGFYIGLALVIIGSWVQGIVIFRRHRRFKKEHPGEKTP